MINERVTVDEAISKGHKMVTYPGMVLMFSTFGFTYYLSTQNTNTFLISLIGLILGFVFSWIYWSIMITKWRLWAFENVRNVHELKKRAIQEKLIWADRSIFEKTEFRTLRAKEKWISLQSKFNQEDIFNDDINIPDETIICYSKGINYLQMTLNLFYLGVGLYLFSTSDDYILALILIMIGAYTGYKDYKEATNKKPQIILNDQGLKTFSTEFYKWKDIENENVISEHLGKNTHYYLIYNHPGGSEKIQINDYNTNQKSLNNLLRIYRGRNKKNNYR